MSIERMERMEADIASIFRKHEASNMEIIAIIEVIKYEVLRAGMNHEHPK